MLAAFFVLLDVSDIGLKNVTTKLRVVQSSVARSGGQLTGISTCISGICSCTAWECGDLLLAGMCSVTVVKEFQYIEVLTVPNLYGSIGV